MRDSYVDVAVVGPGNIGTDLIYKLTKRSRRMRLRLVAGIYENSPGLLRARDLGIETSSRGIEELLSNDSIRIVFDASSAHAHAAAAPRLREAGKIAVDLTPAAVGPYVCPAVNLLGKVDEPNINLITCGGQATIPIVYAVSRVVPVNYAEIVAVISSKSAGSGTRANIDEFTRTTAEGLVRVGGAAAGKAIILLNPADPPMIMNNTIYLAVDDYHKARVRDSVAEMVESVQKYVPGYRLKIEPSYDGERIVVMLQVEGAGDYLPTYAGNLDIETSAALAIGEEVAEHLLSGGEGGL